MELIRALRRLWRHGAFRRLLLIRLLSQAADGTLLVGMGSYVLFSPQTQPNAWAVAGVLALTLLPFTLVGPFVSPLLDKWSRRQVVVVCDTIRAGLALLIGAIVFAGGTSGGWQVLLFGALLVAMSINRFVMAGLSAAMQHTVDDDEFLSASSILPTLGPGGVVLGFVIGAVTRFSFGSFLPAHQADAVVFWIAVVLFAGSVLTARGFARVALGPDRAPRHVETAGEVLRGLARAWQHLKPRGPVRLTLLVMASSRFLFGLFTVAVILAARNFFNTTPEAALADLTIWGLMTGVGFVSATAFVPMMARIFGLRRAAVLFLVLGAVVQALPALVPQKWLLFVASIFLGLSVQAFKIAADTVTQAHVGESFKGRVFVFYDVLFNSSLVVAAVVAALILPPTGISILVYSGMAATHLLLALVFGTVSRRMGAERFEKGTEALVGRAA